MTEKELVFRMTEKTLYSYPENLTKMETLKMRLNMLKNSGSVKAQSYEGAATGGGEIHDPVSDRVQKIMELENRLIAVQSLAMPITGLKADLEMPNIERGSHKAIMAEILNRYYICGNVWRDVADKAGISRAAFFRYRTALVHIASEYLAFNGKTDLKLFPWYLHD